MNAQASDKDVNNEHVLDSAPARALTVAKCSPTKQTIQIAFQKMHRKAIKLQMERITRKISFCSVCKEVRKLLTNLGAHAYGRPISWNEIEALPSL